MPSLDLYNLADTLSKLYLDKKSKKDALDLFSEMIYSEIFWNKALILEAKNLEKRKNKVENPFSLLKNIKTDSFDSIQSIGLP